MVKRVMFPLNSSSRNSLACLLHSGKVEVNGFQHARGKGWLEAVLQQDVRGESALTCIGPSLKPALGGPCADSG